MSRAMPEEAGARGYMAWGVYAEVPGPPMGRLFSRSGLLRMGAGDAAAPARRE